MIILWHYSLVFSTQMQVEMVPNPRRNRRPRCLRILVARRLSAMPVELEEGLSRPRPFIGWFLGSESQGMEGTEWDKDTEKG